MDLPATILAALGLPRPDGWRGRDLLDPSREPPTHLVLEGSDRNEIAVRTPAWLYRQSRSEGNARRTRNLGFEEGRPVQLYDLAADPEEREDVRAEHPPTLGALSEIAAAFLAGEELVAAERLMDPDHRAALEALGYLEGGDETEANEAEPAPAP